MEMRLYLLMLALLLCLSISVGNTEETADAASKKDKRRSRQKKAEAAAAAEESLQDPDGTELVGLVDDIQAVICAVVRNEELYIDEWIQYHKYVGFTRVLLYDVGQNKSAVLEQLPVKYGKFVRVRHHPANNAYRSAYYQCARPYITKRIWAAFIDIDEFIVLRKHMSIKDMLNAVAPFGGAVSINRYAFGSSGLKQYTPEPVLYRFQTRAAALDPYVKTIAYIPHILRVYPHFTAVKKGFNRVDCARNVLSLGNTNRNGTDDIAVIHHYHAKSLEEFRLRQLSSNTTLSNAMALKHGPTVDIEKAIVLEFERIEKDANAERDPRAFEFFEKGKAKMPDFPPKAKQQPQVV